MPPQYHRWSVNQSQLALLEFVSVQQDCPPGVYISATPGSPSTWQGTFFVRQGTYATAVLRFHVIIPSEFPERAPSLVFDSEVFHPLVASGTRTFSNASPPRRPQKAGDSLRLPTGGMNLGHGFPEWFRKRSSGDMPTTMEQRVREAMAESPSPVQDAFGHANISEDEDDDDNYGQDDTPSKPGKNQSREIKQLGGLAGIGGEAKRLMFMPPPAADSLEYSSTRSYSGLRAVLEYMVQAFEDDDFLDGIGFDDAANEGALKAWKAYRIQAKEAEEVKKLKKLERERLEKENEAQRSRGATDEGTTSGTTTPRGNRSSSILPGSATSLRSGFNASLSKAQVPRSPQQWDWNGVWLERVRKLVKDSTSEARLYKEGSGGVPGNREEGTIEMIRFLDLEKEEVTAVKDAVKLSRRESLKTELRASASSGDRARAVDG